MTFELNDVSRIRVEAPVSAGSDPLSFEGSNIGAVISYVGTGFSGFAFQQGQSTIAGELLGAMSKCIGCEPKLTVAGRTDRGVHARGQVISFQIPPTVEFVPDRFVKSMNSLVDQRISVRVAWTAELGFNARFSARHRTYRYRFIRSNTRDPFIEPFCWRIQKDLDLALMREASSFLLGEHDFSSFCRKDPNGASLCRRVDSIIFDETASGYDLWITASSFCHQMVRSIAGLLYQVGESHVAPRYVLEALESHDRSHVKLLAPPSGLTLWEVGYDRGVLPPWS